MRFYNIKNLLLIDLQVESIDLEMSSFQFHKKSIIVYIFCIHLPCQCFISFKDKIRRSKGIAACFHTSCFCSNFTANDFNVQFDKQKYVPGLIYNGFP